MKTRRVLTAAIWVVSLINLSVAGLIATIALVIAQNFDPTEMLTQQTIEPWTDALIACAAFAGLVVASGLSLWLTHTKRFWIVGLILTAGETAGVIWACLWISNEYL